MEENLTLTSDFSIMIPVTQHREQEIIPTVPLSGSNAGIIATGLGPKSSFNPQASYYPINDIQLTLAG